MKAYPVKVQNFKCEFEYGIIVGVRNLGYLKRYQMPEFLDNISKGLKKGGHFILIDVVLPADKFKPKKQLIQK